ncbi:MAG TPA: MarR family winged helix-turn-helix transcriptional regulator [Chloroflexota bacterium]|nr:MarR family winged helix-turn-helix transcriptional regulator [Chloroflexota bacterium]HUM70656.1 MarR family winged helix-turn-helix transcriptional regulator [Chloroflexota bacterium]
MKRFQFQLNDNEEKVLAALAGRGAMSPSQVAAETWILPGDMRTMLQEMASAGFVVLREDSNSPDGWLVALTNDARGFVNGSNGKR